MRFVVVTGMSGGGKRTALKMLEDAGFYCVDNLPVPLIEKFVELIAAPGSEISKVALGLDVRADQPFEEARKTLGNLKNNGYKYEILFMDASHQVLLKRYKESRRLHPLSPEGRVEDGIRKERDILKGIKENSDYVIDTSNLLTRELKEEIDRIFIKMKNTIALWLRFFLSVLKMAFRQIRIWFLTCAFCRTRITLMN